MRTRILYCEGNTDGTIGGSYFSLLYLVSGIDKSLYDPVVVFRRHNNLIQQFQEAGIDTRVVENPLPFSVSEPGDDSTMGYRLTYPVLRIFQKGVNFLRFLPVAAIRHARFLRVNKVDLVHLNNSIVRNHDWMLAARLVGIRCITHERGINRQYSCLSRYFASRLDAVICISNAVRNCLESHGISMKLAVTIYNGIDPSMLKVRRSAQQIRDTHGIDRDSKLVGVVGNIKQWKGQETMIRALPKILDAFPGTSCLLIGAVSPNDADYERHLHQLIADLGLQHNVTFTGYTTDVAAYVDALDVVVHTSIDPEPFGRVLIEAMSLRKPLVGAAAGAVPEIIANGKTGLTFPPGDSAVLAACITKILEDPIRSKEMAKLGFERLMQYFHINKNVTMTERLYESLMDHRP